MNIHTAPVRLFLSTIEKWMTALHQRDAQGARFFVEQLHTAAEMLAIDPVFARMYRQHVTGCSVVNAAEVIHCLCAFFNAVSEATENGRFRSRLAPPTTEGDGYALSCSTFRWIGA